MKTYEKQIIICVDVIKMCFDERFAYIIKIISETQFRTFKIHHRLKPKSLKFCCPFTSLSLSRTRKPHIPGNYHSLMEDMEDVARSLSGGKHNGTILTRNELCCSYSQKFRHNFV